MRALCAPFVFEEADKPLAEEITRPPQPCVPLSHTCIPAYLSTPILLRNLPEEYPQVSNARTRSAKLVRATPPLRVVLFAPQLVGRFGFASVVLFDCLLVRSCLCLCRAFRWFGRLLRAWSPPSPDLSSPNLESIAANVSCDGSITCSACVR